MSSSPRDASSRICEIASSRSFREYDVSTSLDDDDEDDGATCASYELHLQQIGDTLADTSSATSR